MREEENCIKLNFMAQMFIRYCGNSELLNNCEE
jgi:hypothetical protein